MLNRIVLTAFIAICFGPAAARCAGIDGSVDGTVTSTSGAPVAGATVTARGQDVNVTQVTDAKGKFSFTLPANLYNFDVTQGGFVPAHLDDQAVFLGETLKLSITLTEADLSSLRSMAAVSSTGQASINAGAAATSLLSRQDITDFANPQINDVMQHLPDVNIERMGTQLDTTIVLGGVQPYETQVLVDGHPFSSGNFGVWLSEYFPSFLLSGVEIQRGAGNMTPLGNTAVGGTANLLTPTFTDKPESEFVTGVDNYDSQYSRFLTSGSVDKLRYVLELGYGSNNGPYFGKNICSVLPENPSTENQPGSVGIVQFCAPGSASLFTKAELLKLQYAFSQRTSFEIGIIGIAAGLHPQGTGYGQYLGVTQIVQCLPTSPALCTNPSANQYVGKAIDGYYWYPGSNVYANQPIFTGQLRTSFGRDTLLLRPYAGNLTHYTDGSDENSYAWLFGPNTPAFTDPNTGYCNTGTGGSGYLKTTPPTIVDGYAECFQQTFSELEHDKLSGGTLLYLHPFGDNLLTFAYDYHSDNTFAYFNNPSQVATPDTTEGYGTLSLVADLHYLRNVAIKLGLYDTSWTLAGSDPVPGSTPDPSSGLLPLQSLTRTVSRVDPRIGLVYQPRSSVSFRAAYGTSETYPFAGQVSGEPAVQLPSALGPGTVTQKNALLNPETATQFNIGADMRLRPGGVLSVDIEDTSMRNVFETLDTPGAITLPGLGSFALIQPINAARLNAELATIRYALAPTAGFGYNASIAFDRSQIEGVPDAYYAAGAALPANGQQICGSGGGFNPGITTCIPYMKGYGQLTYTFRDRTFAALGVDVEGKNNPYYQPPFAQWDLAVRRPVSRDLEVQASVQNLLNTNDFYNLPMPNAGVSTVAGLPGGALTSVPSILIPASPRTVRLSLRWHTHD